MKLNKGFTLIELMIVMAIAGIFISIAMAALKDDSHRNAVPYEQVREQNRRELDQLQVERDTPTITQKDSEREVCLGGIKYWLVVRDGATFMSPKVDRYSGNETC